MPHRVKTFLVAGSIALVPLHALAQASASASTPLSRSQAGGEADAALATQTGSEVSAGVGGYTYTEPGDTSISIHGPKFAAGYTAAVSFSPRHHWFLQADGRALAGSATYDGWCSPFLIRPDSTSPNGYALGLGERSPCSEDGDSDWYVEGRALFGKDLIGRNWGWSPQIGVGARHLSNGTTGIAGYRTDNYLYLPIGITARTIVGSQHGLSFNLEYDQLLHGWQTTRDSQLGGGDIPATPSAPAFTIDGFSDISFDQHSGWGLRARAKYQLSTQWSVEPEYIHWNVGDSTVEVETATFTVNRITARQQLGAYEPRNTTDEFVVKVGFHF